MNKMILRRFLVLLSGTTAAQLLPLLTAPIIARSYDVSEFGVFGLFVATSAICATVANFKYENAILATRSITATNAILGLSIAINCGIGLVIAICLLIGVLAGWEGPTQAWLEISLFLPLSVMLAGLQQAISNVALQNEHFSSVARGRFTAAFLTAALSVLAALVHPTAGALIAASLIGQGAGLILMASTCLGSGRTMPSFRKVRMRAMAYRHWRFALYTSPADLLNALSSNLPALFLGALYGTAATGAYVLAQRLIGTPLMLIGSAFSDLYRQQVGRHVAEERPYWQISLRTIAAMAPIGAGVLVLVLMFGRDGTTLFLGESWDLAGTICILMIWVYVLRFIVSPLTFSFYLANRHIEDLFLQALCTVAVGFAYLASKQFHWTIEGYVTALAWILSIMYLTYGARALQFAWHSLHKTPNEAF